MTAIEKLASLDPTKRNAFLALFAGARHKVLASRRGDTGEEIPPSFGKAECEWVDDWRDFYGRELPSLGFTTFDESEPRPMLGMVEGSTGTDVFITITAEGTAAREAYWNSLNRGSEHDGD